MSVDKEKYKVKKDLEFIEECNGRGTELISVYIPPDKQISDVSNYLRNEYAQSSNIKSKSTRKNVMSAIDSILSKLKYFKKPPPNGLVLFVGHKKIGADQTQMVSFVIEPSEPITTFLYRCDSRFYTDILRETLADKDVYGLIVIDRKEATLGLLKGRRIIPIKNVQSLVPSKHRMGGQSSVRFERLIEIAAHEFFVKIGNLATEAFLNNKEIKGILIGGPGATKDFFFENDYLRHEIKKLIMGTFDTCYTDEFGLKELVDSAKEELESVELMKEKKLVQRLFEEIKKVDGLAAYGEADVRDALDKGAVDTLIISDGLRRFRAKFKCPSCGAEFEKTIGKEETSACPSCKASVSVGEKEDLIEELYKTAESSKAKVELISGDSEEGDIFLKAFGGMAAILRYRLSA